MMLMKVQFCVVIIACSISLIWSEDASNENMDEKKKEYIVDCKKANKDLTEKEFDEIVNKRMDATTQAGRCLIACFYEKMKFLSANNSIQQDQMKKEVTRLNPEGGDEFQRKLKILEICKKNEVMPIPTDICDAAENFKKCLVSEKVNLKVNTRLW